MEIIFPSKFFKVAPLHYFGVRDNSLLMMYNTSQNKPSITGSFDREDGNVCGITLRMDSGTSDF